MERRVLLVSVVDAAVAVVVPVARPAHPRRAATASLYFKQLESKQKIPLKSLRTQRDLHF
jgi:hypothetical protein